MNVLHHFLKSSPQERTCRGQCIDSSFSGVKVGCFLLETGQYVRIWVISGHWQGGEETYLFLLLIEVINDDTNEQVQGEEGAEDDEDDKVDVHIDVILIFRLLIRLSKGRRRRKSQLLHWD